MISFTEPSDINVRPISEKIKLTFETIYQKNGELH